MLGLRRDYVVRPERCVDCGRCLAICPAGAVRPAAAGGMEVDTARCRRCGACRKVCPQRAITYRVCLKC